MTFFFSIKRILIFSIIDYLIFKKYVGSSELMISGENGDLQQSEFSNTSCCQSDAVALQ